jgi:hypothetical protein
MEDGKFTDPSELKVLHEILKENGINEMPSFVKSKTPISNTLTEQPQTDNSQTFDEDVLWENLFEGQYSKDDLISLIKSTELSEKDLIRVTRIVDAVGSESGIVELLQTQKNFDESTAKQVFRMATESDSYKQLLDMLNNPENQISLSELGQSGNLIEKVSATDVTTEFAKEMADLVPYTSVKMGRYEMFLRLFLQGGQSPSKKGDVEVNGEEMEVKSTISKGSGFRLRGQSGYGNGKQVQQSFLKQLNDIYGKGGPNHGGSQNIPQDILDAYKTQNGQMWYGTKDSWAVLANRDLIEVGLKEKDEVVQMWATALSELYPNTTPETISPFIAPAFKDNGDIAVKEAAARLAAYEFTIYRAAEGFAYFIAVNYQDNYGFIPNDVEGDALVDIFSSMFKVVSLPNTKNNSTPQDSLTAIELA